MKPGESLNFLASSKTSARGLYDSRYEHDSCGTGFVASLKAESSHQIVQDALTALARLEHRGAVAADGKSSDGVGILTAIPRAFFCRAAGLELAAEQPLAVGMFFLPQESSDLAAVEFDRAAAAEDLIVLAWRNVPLDRSVLGASALETLPVIRQVLLTQEINAVAGDTTRGNLERRLYLVRKQFERAATGAYVCSLSAETVVYKSLCAGRLLADFYPDLRAAEFTSPFALFHQRYATNVLPSWHLAQPLRTLAHNGEINTIWGNRARMAARLSMLPQEYYPILSENGSDSTSLDETVELLARTGRTLAEAVRMLVPPAMQQMQTAFLRYHADCTEPWDGPAALTFADGTLVGAALDRNGLRPCRYAVTRQGLVVAGSEAGLVDLAPEDITQSGRVGPGQMIVVDLKAHRLYTDSELHVLFDRAEHYSELLEKFVLEGIAPRPVLAADKLQQLQRSFGYTREDTKIVLQSMAQEGKDAIWSMGDDTPIAPLASTPRPLYAYFRQRFAQVTNPPIDPLRESCVFSLRTRLGPWPDLLNRHARLPGLSLTSPFLSLGQMEALRQRQHPLHDRLPLAIVECKFPVDGSLRDAIGSICLEAQHLIEGGARILLLTDRISEGDGLPIPMAMAVGAVHHALVRAGLRTRAGLAVEAGDCRDLHHAAVLIGFGAGAVCPWLALETARQWNPEQGEAKMLHAFEAGLAKVMSKMGISVLDSYRGAQLFDALGLDEEVIGTCFPGTGSPLSGIGFAGIEAMVRAVAAGSPGSVPPTDLPDPGWVRYRKDAESHAWQPPTVKALQIFTGSSRGAAVATEESAAAWSAFTHEVQDRRSLALRDLLEIRAAAPALVPSQVESPSKLSTRFIASAMSLGSLSPEAHQTITLGVNSMGARSNSGEGGEDPDTYAPSAPDAPAVRRDNKIKQVASGRFGVTAEYLAHADELEIKVAQGSKPGEGGQLPSHKVTALIARLRHSQPGVALISPPPHHDIYSIEDLAQLIYDLKRVNPRARVGVKLVSELGVGTVAAGVAKAYADYVTIAGHAGGTGASPLSSIKHTGNPWEIGLAETQQVLMNNGLRGRIRVRVDGGLCTARDVLIAALLGAEEFAFGTSVLVALGCDMARQCHLNTCPAGIATQKPELRAKFRGKPEHVVRFFEQIASELQGLLAEFGLPSLDAAIGRVDLLEQVRHNGNLDLSPLLVRDSDGPTRCIAKRNDRPEDHAPLDDRWVQPAINAFRQGTSFTGVTAIHNGDRSFGARIAGELALIAKTEALPGGGVHLHCSGTAGQSFGAFAITGMHLLLDGQANDFVGKGLSGGELVLCSTGQASRDSAHHILLGNVALYGATAGSLFASGRAGERFAVRNSGATAVVEGIGDHGCEYMTGGVVVVLGAAGTNFGAGMTGGAAFVLDEDGSFLARENYHPAFLKPCPFSQMTDEMQHQVHALVSNHRDKTGSLKAEKLLAGWPTMAQAFVYMEPLPQA
ncbi:MAG TPA: glutamate synthase large subunit [Acidobacteriaceae bacterium]|nr:glutamate synthase large subunit [Acidobacteriaceae bacterium]